MTFSIQPSHKRMQCLAHKERGLEINRKFLVPNVLSRTERRIPRQAGIVHQNVEGTTRRRSRASKLLYMVGRGHVGTHCPADPAILCQSRGHPFGTLSVSADNPNLGPGGYERTADHFTDPSRSACDDCGTTRKVEKRVEKLL